MFNGISSGGINLADECRNDEPSSTVEQTEDAWELLRVCHSVQFSSDRSDKSGEAF